MTKEATKNFFWKNREKMNKINREACKNTFRLFENHEKSKGEEYRRLLDLNTQKLKLINERFNEFYKAFDWAKARKHNGKKLLRKDVNFKLIKTLENEN